MPAIRISALATVGLVLLLQACAETPVESQPEELPELTLNLPQEGDCSCVSEEQRTDYTFLEKGFAALAAGEHIEAVQHFQRYQRLESSPEANWEAGIAIAFVSTLSHSPFYDPEAARQSFRRLRKEDWKDMQLHEQSLLMRHSLESFAVTHRRIGDLENNNATLKEDLEKREEALKRLRELTLGQ